MEGIQPLVNVITLVFIVSTMLAAGLGTTLGMLAATFRHLTLVGLVLVANFVLVPLAGWGVAAAFALPGAAYVALLLIAASPGAPFGAKLAMVQHGDVVGAASLQVLLAALGSVLFPVVANLLLGVADVGGGISLGVGQLVLTVAVLQLVPFAVGLALRRWAPHAADEWQPPLVTTSTLTLVAALFGALLGSWEQVVDLIGSRTLVAAFAFAALAVVIGLVVSPGPTTTRTSMGTLAAVRNAGPILAAVGIAFGNDPAMLGAVGAELLIINAVAVAVAAFLARGRTPVEQPAEGRHVRRDHLAPARGDVRQP